MTVGVIVGLGGIVVVGLALLPRVWRSSADRRGQDATGRVSWSEAWQAAFFRGIPVVVATLLCLELATVAAFFEDTLEGRGSETAGTLTIVFGILFFLGLLVDLCVTLVNQPKAVVPPAARSEPGALASWWGGRKRGRVSGR